ncbi:MAG: LysE family transporter [Hyphomicrobiales bacterium]|nr:LysE family transporter [Hyphomicrobiales bacterium]
MTVIASTFLAGFALSAALIMAIGAQNLFVLRQGLRREHVGPIVLICGCADAILIAAGVGGAGAILATAPRLAGALSAGGAVFLFWYGAKALRRAASPGAMDASGGEPQPLGRALAAAAAFTFLNPHAYLDTVLVMGAAGSAQVPGLRPTFALGAAAASFAWFAALGFGARKLSRLFAKPAAWRVLDAAVGATMLSLAASLALHAV